MTETIQIWLFAGSFGLIGVLFTLWWHHALMCKGLSQFTSKDVEAISRDVAVIRSILERVQEDIGTHDTGMRGDIHKLRQEVTPFVIEAQIRQRQQR